MLSYILFIKNSQVTSPKSVSLKRKRRKSNDFIKAHRENELTWDAFGVTNWPSVPCTAGFPGSWTSGPKPGKCPREARPLRAYWMPGTRLDAGWNGGWNSGLCQQVHLVGSFSWAVDMKTAIREAVWGNRCMTLDSGTALCWCVLHWLL